jgi:hypothetical protein
MEGFIDHGDNSNDNVIIYKEAKVVITRATGVLR